MLILFDLHIIINNLGLNDLYIIINNLRWYKTNLRDLIAATSLVIKLDSNRRFFSPCDLEIWWMTSETLNSRQNRQFFVLCDLEIWQMTLENNGTPLLCYFKLCASFGSHWWIQTVRVRKCLIWVENDDFLAVWPWNWTDDLGKQQATYPK